MRSFCVALILTQCIISYTFNKYSGVTLKIDVWIVDTSATNLGIKNYLLNIWRRVFDSAVDKKFPSNIFKLSLGPLDFITIVSLL